MRTISLENIGILVDTYLRRYSETHGGVYCGAGIVQDTLRACVENRHNTAFLDYKFNRMLSINGYFYKPQYNPICDTFEIEILPKEQE